MITLVWILVAVGAIYWLIRLRRDRGASSRNVDLHGANMPQETAKKVQGVMDAAVGRGIGPRDTERKLRDVVDDFDWPEFDQWCARFKQSGEWPYLWDDVAEYCDLQEARIDALLEMLKKDALIELAGLAKVTIKKSWTKPNIIAALLAAKPPLDRQMVMEKVDKIWKPRYLRGKRFLFTHTTECREHTKEQLTRFRSLDFVSTVEIVGTDDCPICKRMAGKKISLRSATPDKLPPYHPGCRCTILSS